MMDEKELNSWWDNFSDDPEPEAGCVWAAVVAVVVIVCGVILAFAGRG